MQNITYPKVFVLLEPFNDSTGMGVTMTNLFKDWPKEKLAIAAYELDEDLCEKIRPCCSYFSFSHPAKFKDTGIRKSHKSKSFSSKLRKIAKYFYSKLGINDIRSIPISYELKKSIIDFQPDIIFTALGDLKRIRFAGQIFNFYSNSKLAVYIVDDWPNTKQNGRWFPNLWKKIYDRSLRRLLDKTTYFLSICQTMSDCYRSEYGKKFVPFHNPVDNEIWNSIAPIKHYPKNIFSIVYVGKINRDTKENILTLAAVVDSLNKHGKKVVFDVYTPSLHDIDTSKYVGFNILSSISNDQIPVTLKGYDALYLTLGFSKESRAYTRLSMPTKLTEYLASGVPILLNAPSEIAVTKYVAQTNTGIICSENSAATLEEKLGKLVNDSELRDRLKTNALNLAREHDITIVRTKFKEALTL